MLPMCGLFKRLLQSHLLLDKSLKWSKIAGSCTRHTKIQGRRHPSQRNCKYYYNDSSCAFLSSDNRLTGKNLPTQEGYAFARMLMKNWTIRNTSIMALILF
jgi:hypothetical protein